MKSESRSSAKSIGKQGQEAGAGSSRDVRQRCALESSSRRSFAAPRFNCSLLPAPASCRLSINPRTQNQRGDCQRDAERERPEVVLLNHTTVREQPVKNREDGEGRERDGDGADYADERADYEPDRAAR